MPSLQLSELAACCRLEVAATVIADQQLNMDTNVSMHGGAGGFQGLYGQERRWVDHLILRGGNVWPKAFFQKAVWPRSLL